MQYKKDIQYSCDFFLFLKKSTVNRVCYIHKHTVNSEHSNVQLHKKYMYSNCAVMVNTLFAILKGFISLAQPMQFGFAAIVIGVVSIIMCSAVLFA